ncbi:MAG: hypothetical protein R3B91_15435 [Planctomycetaceae bacterium]
MDHPRGGTALVVVLVVIVLLSLAAYTFTELMLAETEATERYGRGALTQAFADSGVELAAAAMFRRRNRTPSICITTLRSFEPHSCRIMLWNAAGDECRSWRQLSPTRPAHRFVRTYR